MKSSLLSIPQPDLTTPLLHWYKESRRLHLPWRAPLGKTADPYHVLVSEVMLQQTTVATVINYFLAFIKAFPTYQDLAQASLETIHTYWKGLGYYRRADYLHQTAKALCSLKTWPTTPQDLIKLPGIGPYTASSIAALAFYYPTLGVDGNLERIFSRLWCIDAKKNHLKKQAQDYIHAFHLSDRSGDINQALMDLGATVCRPITPLCAECPLRTHCKAFLTKTTSNFPKKEPKKELPTRMIKAYVMFNQNGQIGMIKRPDQGLFAKQWGLPLIGLDTEPPPHDINLDQLENISEPIGNIQHTFTHFKALVQVYKGKNISPLPFLTYIDDVKNTFMHKIIEITHDEKRIMKIKKDQLY